MSLPAHVTKLLDLPAPEFVSQLFVQTSGRLPNEYETSFYLHWLLISGGTRESVAEHILQFAPKGDDAGHAFVFRVYAGTLGRAPGDAELSAALAGIAEGGLVERVALLRRLAAESAALKTQNEPKSPPGSVLERLKQCVGLFWNLPFLWRDVQNVQRRQTELQEQLRVVQLEIDELVRALGR